MNGEEEKGMSLILLVISDADISRFHLMFCATAHVCHLQKFSLLNTATFFGKIGRGLAQRSREKLGETGRKQSSNMLTV